MLAAAAEDTGELAVIARAVAEVGLGIDALDPAQQVDLISLGEGAITFRHPLVRSAIYAGAPIGQRQRVHAALASALSGEGHADRRIWHQAMATLSADEGVAAALEASAHRSRGRSAHASAATAFLRAAELSTAAGVRSRRLAGAARAAWDAGQPDRAREAIAAAISGAEGELKAELLYLKGISEAHAGSVRDAPATLLEAAASTDDTSWKLEILQEAGEAAAYAGDMETVLAVNKQEAAIEARSVRDRFMVAVGAGWVAAFPGDHRTAHDAFTDALECATSLDEPRAMIWAADSASAGFGLGSGLRYANRAVELARTDGLLGLLPMALHRQALELIWNSRFDLAYAAAQEGYRLAVDLGHGTGAHLANMATVEALQGRDQDASAHAQEALAIGRHTGSSLLADSAQMTLGLLELTRGKPEEATDRLLSLTDLNRPSAHVVIALHAVPDLVEAAARANRSHEIAEPVARYRAWANNTPSQAATALLLRWRCPTRSSAGR